MFCFCLHFHLLVTSRPLIKSFPEDMTVTEGSRVEFPVKVSGTPDPQLTWYHESTRLDNDYAHEISTDGTLVIATTEMKHSGAYRLVASNTAGTTEKKFTLKLISEAPEEELATAGSAVSHPVPITELGQYVSRNHADTNKGFTALYRVSEYSAHNIKSLNFFSLLTAVRKNML